MTDSLLALLTLLCAPPIGLLLARLSVTLPGKTHARPGRKRILLMVLAAVALALWAALVIPGSGSIVGAILGWQLLLLAVLDGEHFWLPRLFTLLLMMSGLVATAVLTPLLVTPHLLGAALGFALLATVAFLYRRWRGHEGLGGGDAWLLAGGGAWVGWDGLPSILVIASLAGLLHVAILSARGRQIGGIQPVPFGIGLAIGIWLVWLYGPLDQLL
jgi:leader peptidase (prepilin peptidase)/N-methyltransferase